VFDPDAFVATLLPRLAPARFLARAPVRAALDRLSRPIHLACLGKPAVAYAAVLRDRAVRTLTVGPRGSGADYEGSHPVPDDSSFAAGEALMEFAASVPADDAFLFFVAGGGSALAEVPTVNDVAERTRALLRSGKSIVEINRERRERSKLKGGGLGRACSAKQKLTLVLSDVPTADLTLVASGPVTDGEIVRVAGYAELAAAAAEALRHHGIRSIDVAPALDLPIRDGIALHRDWTPRPAPWALISGGELTVAVTGDGRGGRNSEFVIRMADALRTAPGSWRVLSLATDGVDGNSDAAGGWADPRRLPPDEVADALARSDTAGLLERRGTLLRTGPTQTNLMDLHLLVRDL
jgi:hydroxypyruvate reductase